MHTDIHTSSGIRTHDPSVRAGEDGSCLKPRGHCDRRVYMLQYVARIKKICLNSTARIAFILHTCFEQTEWNSVHELSEMYKPQISETKHVEHYVIIKVTRTYDLLPCNSTFLNGIRDSTFLAEKCCTIAALHVAFSYTIGISNVKQLYVVRSLICISEGEMLPVCHVNVRSEQLLSKTSFITVSCRLLLECFIAKLSTTSRILWPTTLLYR
jgi:hypothetical protein